MINSNKLPPSATNLNVTTPRTSSFYLLPKIHKPANPGRPIVSACSCPTENIAAFLDEITAPLVCNLQTYVKDTKHALQIFDEFRFGDGEHFLFTMDIKSLYMVIPNNDGLRALSHFLDKREVKEPSTATLTCLAELVLTLNAFSFNGDHYRQVSGVAMGSKMGPNYACLFVGFVEDQMLNQYSGFIPQLYRRYIDDVIGAAYCAREDLDSFVEFFSNFHPTLQFTHIITEDGDLPCLDISLSISEEKIATSVHYKPTDTHSYLHHSSSHPLHCKKSIPYSQLLRIRRLCDVGLDFQQKPHEMCTFFD